jgi:hypothetical protein
MSKSNIKKKVVVTTSQKTTPTVARSRSSASSSTAKKGELIFGKTNYILMLAGIGLIALGLILMSGGAMPSPDVWDESIIYSKRRTLLAPIVIILGLVVEIVAIFRKSDTGIKTEGADNPV